LQLLSYLFKILDIVYSVFILIRMSQEHSLVCFVKLRLVINRRRPYSFLFVHLYQFHVSLSASLTEGPGQWQPFDSPSRVAAGPILDAVSERNNRPNLILLSYSSAAFNWKSHRDLMFQKPHEIAL
jgi:hypothetical protein